MDYTAEAAYAATRRPVATATTLIPDAYTSDAFFALDRERVFAGGWVAVGCTGEVAEPGDAAVVEVAGRSVIVVRGRDGVLRGFYNVCRHRGTRLLDEGRCRIARAIRCPYHSWAYDLEGRCLGAPLFDRSDVPDDQRAIFDTSAAPSFDEADHGLLPVAVDTFGPLVLACLDPGAGPLAEPLGDLPARLAGYRLDEWRLARTGAYEIAANWKLVGENFMEYYHLPWVHPGLVQVSPMEAHHRWQGTGLYSGMCTSPIAADADAGGWESGLAPIPGLGEDDAVSARFVWLFPQRRAQRAAQPRVPDPRDPARARAHERAHVPAHAPGIDSSSAQPGRRGRVRQARGLLGRGQPRGHRDRRAGAARARDDAVPGRAGRAPMPRFEEPVHRFQNMVADRMVGLRRVPGGDAEVRTPMFTAPVD